MMRHRFRFVMSPLSAVVMVCFLTVQVTCWIPKQAHAGASEDLKQIEYKYYFRGKYDQAIDALRVFLERPDLSPVEEREAREFLAASLVLTGSVGEGKDQFLKILNSEDKYDGPDPALFGENVITVFEDAKTEYASVMIKQIPEAAADELQVDAIEPAAAQQEQKGKPIYKKWWFYTAIGAVVVVAAAAAAKDEDSEREDRKVGLITVGVTIH